MTASPTPPWSTPDLLPPRPTDGEYGYLDANELPVAVPREKLMEVCAENEDIWYVWTPATATCVPPTEVDFLEPVLSAREKVSAGYLVKKGAIATILGSAIIIPFWSNPNALIIALLTLLFGLFPLLYGLFLYRRSQAAHGPADRSKEARLEYWMEEQSAIFSFALIGVLAVVFAGQLLIGVPESISRLGSSTQSVRAGDWWRMLTAVLAHGHLPHLLVNGYAIYYLGQRVEMLTGKAYLLLVFLLAGLLGVIASYLFNDPRILSVGASGGICGLLGFLLVLYRKNRAILPASFVWPLFLGSISLIGLGLVIPNIDHFGHVGGLLCGLLLGLALAPCLSQPTGRKPVLQVIGYGAALVILTGAGGALYLLFKAA